MGNSYNELRWKIIRNFLAFVLIFDLCPFMIISWLFQKSVKHPLLDPVHQESSFGALAYLSLSLSFSPSLSLYKYVTWQRSEHGNIFLRYEPCSVSYSRLMTTGRAWWYIPKVWTMLCQLLSSSDNGQSMLLYPSGINHALSVVIV